MGFGVWRMGSVLVGSDDADGAGRQAGRQATNQPTGAAVTVQKGKYGAVGQQ